MNRKALLEQTFALLSYYCLLKRESDGLGALSEQNIKIR